MMRSVSASSDSKLSLTHVSLLLWPDRRRIGDLSLSELSDNARGVLVLPGPNISRTAGESEGGTLGA
jgi:hypothetical protein